MQNGFAGVGNWMADEILWRSKINPAQLAGKLRAKERREILDQTKFVAREAMRTLAKDFSDPPEDWLIHQKWKANGICPRHGIKLSHAIVGGRSTVWCSRCQK